MTKALLPMVAALMSAAGMSQSPELDKPRCGRPDGPCYFASFENPAEAARWKATGGATAVQSRDFPSWQTHSLRVEVPAGKAGGVETGYVPNNWQRYEALQFFVYAGQAGVLKLETGDGSNWSTRSVNVRKGANLVQFRMREFAGIEPSRISRMRLTVTAAADDAVLYLDRFRLGDFNEVLAKFGRMDVPYDLTVKTPHVRWARPLSSGPLKILIVPDVAHGRAAVELAERLDCELFPVTLGESSGTNRWGFGDFYGERGDSYGAPFTLAHTLLADQLLNGPQFDVMVLPGTRPWNEFSEVVRKAIRRRVEAGMGLVLLNVTAADAENGSDLLELSPLQHVAQGRSAKTWYADGKHYITRNVPLAAFPYEQMRYTQAHASGEVLIKTGTGDPILAVKRVGKGRVVAAAWDQRGLIPLVRSQFQTSATLRYWEYMYSMLARSVVWASGKEPASSIESIEADSRSGRVVVRSSGEAHTVEIKVSNEHSVVEESLSRKAGQTVTAALPAVPNGQLHFVDVLLKSADGKVLDWGTASYNTYPPAAISGLRFSSDRFALGAPVTGEFDLKGAGSAGLTLYMSLSDNYGRLLAEHTEPLKADSSKIPFSLATDGALTRVVWVEGRIEENGRERHRMRRDVFVLQPRKWNDYDVVMYLFGTDPAPGLWDTVQSRLREMYVTTLSSYPLELSKYANFGVQAQTRISGQESPDGAAREPYLAQKKRYFETKDKQYLARLSCLSDPAYLKRQEREIERLVSPWVPFSPMSYYIYEEPSLTCYEDAMDLCFSPHCMARMREWLKKQYVSLEALNREWGSRFARWDDVIPDTTEEAQAKDNYAAWADHRTFMEEVYAGNYAYVRELLHRYDRDGLVLLSGTQESVAHNGCDYYQLDQIVGHLNPYRGGNQLEFHRSFNPRLRSSGGTGYGASGRQAFYNLYSDLFHGFWAGAYIFWQYSILNPDYQFCGSARDIQKVLAELQGGGIARLISSATRDNMRIAVHYSYPSIHGAWIPDGNVTRPDQNPSSNLGPTGRKFEENRDGWVNALKDLGYQFDMVARQQIEAGELTSQGFRLLVLPFSVAITDQEAREIRRFAESGGVVIADGQAGVMDGHAKWLDRGSLDDLFGIERSAPARRKEIASSSPERSVKPGTGNAVSELDGVPVLIKHDYGKGKGIYLNFFLASYVEDRRDAKEGKWKEMLDRAFTEAGIRPLFRVVGPGGRPLDGLEQISYSSGAARYLGLLKNEEIEARTTQMTVELDQQYHIYDVRARKYYGLARSFQDSIRTAEPKLYALLPAAVGAVRISPDGRAQRGARFGYKLAVDAGRGVNPVMVVRVYRPDGIQAREYSENLAAKGGAATGGFHLALNDPAGTWKLVATDAATGRQATLAFTVQR